MSRDLRILQYSLAFQESFLLFLFLSFCEKLSGECADVDEPGRKPSTRQLFQEFRVIKTYEPMRNGQEGNGLYNNNVKSACWLNGIFRIMYEVQELEEHKAVTNVTWG